MRGPCSSTLVQADGWILLVDCGPCVRRLLNHSGVSIKQVDAASMRWKLAKLIPQTSRPGTTSRAKVEEAARDGALSHARVQDLAERCASRLAGAALGIGCDRHHVLGPEKRSSRGAGRGRWTAGEWSLGGGGAVAGRSGGGR